MSIWDDIRKAAKNLIIPRSASERAQTSPQPRVIPQRPSSPVRVSGGSIVFGGSRADKYVPPRKSPVRRVEIHDESTRPRAVEARAKAAASTQAAAKPPAETDKPTDPFRLGIALPGKPTAAELTAYLQRAQQMGSITYDPQINAIVRTQELAKQTEARNQGQLTQLYDALSASMAEGGKEAGARTAASLKGITAQYAQLGKDISTDFQNAKNAQMQGAADLGATEGMTATLAPQQANFDLLKGLAAQTGQGTKDALTILGQGAQTRMAEFGAMAQGEGAMRKADLAENLRQILYQTGGQISDLQGAKGKFINELTQQYEDTDFNRKMALAAEARLQKTSEAQINQNAAELELSKSKAIAEAQQDAADAEFERRKLELQLAAGGTSGKVTGIPREALLDEIAPILNDFNAQHPNDKTGGNIETWNDLLDRAFSDPRLSEGDPASPGRLAQPVNAAFIKQLLHEYNSKSHGATGYVNPQLIDRLYNAIYRRMIQNQTEFSSPTG